MGRIGVLGLGAVGSRVVDLLSASAIAADLVVFDVDRRKRDAVSGASNIEVSSSPRLEGADIDVMVVCTPCGTHLPAARAAVGVGVDVVSVSDRIADVRGLLALDAEARERGARVVAGAGFSPGVTCALAAFLAAELDVIDEVHLAKDGTGGPACARQHHRALKSPSIDWIDGQWVRRPGGSGRELVWFPEPVAGADCYRAALPEALVLQRSFPRARRITARLSASRQDRFTSWLPMLVPPHSDGGVGAVRVEVRGRINGAYECRVAGAVARPSTATAAMAAIAADTLASARADNALGRSVTGATGVLEVASANDILRRLRELNVGLHAFEGLGL